jgi:catechol 2,3-dioxygenase
MSDRQEPIFDVAQLAHVELLTPKPERTLWFFKDLLGLQETARQDQSVYLRGYEESYHHSLKITEAAAPGLGHVAWRSTSPQALERRVASIEETGYGTGWVEDELGHGPAYRFSTPDGHPMEIFWDVDYAEIPAGERSALLNRPQRRPSTGIPVRRIDHLNELAMTQTGTGGRLHHVCFWYGVPQHVSDAAELFREHRIPIEAGPGKHGIAHSLSCTRASQAGTASSCTATRAT